MNKIKYTLINRIYDDKSLTSDEISMIIYIAKNCDEFGYVEGVYYKECALELGFSKSQFYSIANSLMEKGYINRHKSYREDVDFEMPENCFMVADENDEPVASYTGENGYLNLNMSIFDEKEFYNLKSGAKKLVLALIVKAVNDKARYLKKGKKSRKIYMKMFHIPEREYDIYSKKLHITRRMVKQYFKDIEKWVGVYNDTAYTEKHILTVKESACKKTEILLTQKRGTVLKAKTDRFDSDRHWMKAFCRRHSIEYEELSMDDSVSLISQYANKISETGQNVRSIVQKAIEAVGTTLNAAGINKYISNYIANGAGKTEKRREENILDILDDIMA